MVGGEQNDYDHKIVRELPAMHYGDSADLVNRLSTAVEELLALPFGQAMSA